MMPIEWLVSGVCAGVTGLLRTRLGGGNGQNCICGGSQCGFLHSCFDFTHLQYPIPVIPGLLFFIGVLLHGRPPPPDPRMLALPSSRAELWRINMDSVRHLLSLLVEHRHFFLSPARRLNASFRYDLSLSEKRRRLRGLPHRSPIELREIGAHCLQKRCCARGT